MKCNKGGNKNGRFRKDGYSVQNVTIGFVGLMEHGDTEKMGNVFVINVWENYYRSESQRKNKKDIRKMNGGCLFPFIKR